MCDQRPVEAIKPLDLDRPEPTEIYDHGDAWTAKFDRLKQFDHFPQRMIIPVSLPAPDDPLRHEAADKITQRLQQLGVQIVPLSDQERLRSVLLS